MPKILVPVDGSAPALRAVQSALAMSGDPVHLELRLLNVQPPVPVGLHAYFTADALKTLAQASADEALDDARRWLDAQGARYTSGFRIGDASKEIVAEVDEAHCEGIVMGTRGLSRVSGALLGSVAAKVVHLARVPVTLVK